MRRGAALAIGVTALALRALRGPARWDEITLAYAAYIEPVSRAWSEGAVGQAVATWVGLHPPLHATLLTLLDAIWPAPAAWILLSLLASAGAALVFLRAGEPLAALVLATSPLQLAYAAEVNNYPLAVLALALCLVAARGPWSSLACAVVFAGWAHVLAGLGGLGVALWRARALARREALYLLGAVGLGLLPVGAGAARRLVWGSSWSQGGLEGGGLAAWAWEAAARVGPEGALIGLLALPGLRGPALAAALPLGLALGASLVLGAAAPHQFPYLLLFGPSLALAAGAASQRRWIAALILALCLVRGARVGAEELSTLAQLQADLSRPRAVDAALQGARSGDRLWLVAPALLPDDDKSDTSPVLARLSPWLPWPRVSLPGFEYTDSRGGQPRQLGGLAVHTSTALDLAAFDAASAQTFSQGGQVWVVLYDHAPAVGLEDDLLLALRPYRYTLRRFPRDAELGPDLLVQVLGPA